MNTLDKEILLFDNRLIVSLPESFQNMDKDKLEMMYPYEDKPKIIMEDKDAFEFCTFTLIKEQSLIGAQVEHALCSIIKIVVSLYPSSLLDEPEFIKSEKGVCGWFSFRTNVKTGIMCNFMYIFPVDGVMMLGTMGCLIENQIGKRRLLKIMESLDIPGHENGDTGVEKSMVTGRIR